MRWALAVMVVGATAACGGTDAPTPGGGATSPTAASSPAATAASPSGSPAGSSPEPTPPFQVVGYFPEWGGDGLTYSVKEVETRRAADRLTVLAYAFSDARPGADGTVTCQVTDPVAAYGASYSAAASVDGAPDAADQPLRGHFNQLRKLKARHPGIRVVMSIGGWTQSTWFSDAARTPASRRAFVTSCIDLYLAGNLPVAEGAGGTGVAAGIFDGFDIDWEFPVAGGDTGIHHDPGDAANLAALAAEFRAQLASIAPYALLTMAVPADQGTVDQYGIPAVIGSLDWLNLMTYDMRGSWNDVTGHHAGLCLTGGQDLSAAGTVTLLRDVHGVPAAKLVLGAAFYGNGWTGVGPAADGLFQPATGAPPGPDGSGSLPYRDLAALTAQGFERHWDATTLAPWLYSPGAKTFWSYDDAESIAAKMAFVKAQGLGGAMFWELSGDDDAGTLTGAIAAGLAPDAPATDPCA